MKKILLISSLSVLSFVLALPDLALAREDYTHTVSGKCKSGNKGPGVWTRTTTYVAATDTKTSDSLYTYDSGLTVTRDLLEAKDSATGDRTRQSQTIFAQNGVPTNEIDLNEAMVPVPGQPGNFTTSGTYLAGTKVSTFVGTDDVTGPGSRYLTWSFTDERGRYKWLTDTLTVTDTEITNHYVGTNFNGDPIDQTLVKKVKNESDGNDFQVGGGDNELLE